MTIHYFWLGYASGIASIGIIWFIRNMIKRDVITWETKHHRSST